MGISVSFLPKDIFGWILMAVDVAIVSYIFYKGMRLIEGTRAVQVVKGIFIVVIFSVFSRLLGLTMVNWILAKLQIVIAVAIPIVFQPELRNALAQLGKGKVFAKPIFYLRVEETARIINEIVRAVQELIDKRTGALIVLEREIGINDYIDTGVKLDSVVTSEILVNLFVPNTPLHDGAVIIRDDRIMAAGCFLPLSDSPYLSSKLGTRHRAGLGISEVSDAITIIVSEETGTLSLAMGGRLTRYLDTNDLKKILEDNLITETYSQTGFFHRRAK